MRIVVGLTGILAFAAVAATGCRHTGSADSEGKNLSKEQVVVKKWRKRFCQAPSFKKPAPKDGTYSCAVARSWKGNYNQEDFQAKLTTDRGTMLTVVKGGVPRVADKILVGAFTAQKGQWAQILGSDTASVRTWNAAGFKTGRRISKKSIIFATVHIDPTVEGESAAKRKPLEAVRYCGALPSDGPVQKAANEGKTPKITHLTHCIRIGDDC